MRIIGVEAESAASMKASLGVGRISAVEDIDTICDGIAVKKPGDLTFGIADTLLDDVVTVDEFQVTRTLFYLLERAKIVAEPAGCVGLAAFLSGAIDLDGEQSVAVISGGNIDMSLMSRLVERELFRLGQSVRLHGIIPNRVGSLNRVLGIVADSNINVLNIEQDLVDPSIAPNKAELELVLEVHDESEINKLINRLNTTGLRFKTR